MTRRIPVAMSIGGSDSSGGAGLEADLKTFTALGVYGAISVTSVTAQNTYRVSAIYDIPGWVVYEQIKAVYEDIGIDAAKTGMLSNSDIVLQVARAVGDFGFKLIVDPVMVSKTGARLLREDAVDVLKKELLPRATIVTPNALEASILVGFSVKTLEDAVKASRRISELYGVEAVVVKGGHLETSEVVDVLYHGNEYYYFKSPRYPHGCFHGAGCAYSAAITALLAKGYNVVEAVKEAKRFIDMAIDYGVMIGRGYCPVNPVAYLEIPAYKYIAIENVKRAVYILLENQDLVLPHTPEVGINVVEAIDIRYARDISDVVGVEGRIVRAGDRLIKVGEVKPGASSHLARFILALIKRGLSTRGAVNIKYSDTIVKRAHEKGLRAIYVDRSKEPLEVKTREGGSMEWIASQIPSNTTVDIVYDKGDIGKEPMIRVLGRSAVEAVEKMIKILS